ncbi:MAG: hypothetical protein ACT4PL_01400 [Phycisphaerales bacterium]
MNYLLVAVLGYVLLGLDLALRPFVAIGAAGGGGEPMQAPYFLLPLVVFIAMYGQPLPVLWTGLVLGLLSDLATGQYLVHATQSTVTIPGPGAIGWCAAAYLVLTLRALVMRRNPIAFIVLCVFAAGLASVVAVAVLSLRQFLGFGDAVPFSGREQLTARLVASLLTAISSAALLLIFRPMVPLFGFDDNTRRFVR